MQAAPRFRNYSWPTIGICLLLGCLTWLVFAQTLRYGFVNYDDGTYVYRNPDVARGLTPNGLVWAFTHVVAANWHPLTVISHMLDCALFGTSPGGHHFSNVLLHTAAVILLFLVLHQTTGALWRSAFVSAVFAIHPLHVESVAWVAERKDVLSGVFFMLTLLAYVAYTRKQTLGRYLAMSILFGLGLMSKPMLVTLPFVLLLMDYWPLDRRAALVKATSRRKEIRDPTSRTGPTVAKLLVEKIPILILSVATSVAALVTQSEQSVAKLNVLSVQSRIGNAFVAFAIYAWQMIWPRNLAVFYPHPGSNLPLWEIALSIAFLAVISLGALALRNRCPYFLTGWFWYVGMLLPVIGIVQVGQQAHADRYTYLPQIGLYWAVTWAVADVSRSWRHRRIILTIVGTTVLAALTWCAWIQTSYWRDSESLWKHAMAVTGDNPIASEHFSDALLDKGRIDEAILEARHGLTFRPVTASAFSMLGVALTRRGDLDEALGYLRSAMELDPKLYLLHYNLGNVLLQKGQIDEAVAHYRSELDTHAGFAEGHNNLANALLHKGDPEQALVHLKKALELNPNYAEARNNFGIALSQLGDMRAAVVEWNKTLEVEPANLNALSNLAWVYSTFPDASIRNGSKALELAKRALEVSGQRNARIWRLAAAANAETGQFPEAIDAARKGLKLAEAEGNDSLVRNLEMNIALFQNNSPLRDTTQAKRGP